MLHTINLVSLIFKLKLDLWTKLYWNECQYLYNFILFFTWEIKPNQLYISTVGKLRINDSKNTNHTIATMQLMISQNILQILIHTYYLHPHSINYLMTFQSRLIELFISYVRSYWGWVSLNTSLKLTVNTRNISKWPPAFTNWYLRCFQYIKHHY